MHTWFVNIFIEIDTYFLSRHYHYPARLLLIVSLLSYLDDLPTFYMLITEKISLVVVVVVVVLVLVLVLVHKRCMEAASFTYSGVKIYLTQS